MGINIGPPEVDELRPRIAVIGVGGAGGNAIANMIAAQVEGVDFVVANTDAQALNASAADSRIQLGPDITQGLGAGSRPEIGRAAAEETIAQVEEALEGAHMCFIAAGMGGGTGTGAAPVIAKAARDKGILTVGVVTKPFTFEGTRRMRSADAGIDELQQNVDTLIVIPNQNLFLVANPNTTFKEAFAMADEVLQQGVRGITDLMVMPGLINLDFADVRSVMHEMGKAMMGTGESEGDGRALEAAEKAIANPLLDGVSMRGAKGVIISITGGEDMRLMEVDEAANHIRELVDPEANIIWGSAFNDNLEGKIRVSVVATGIDADAEGQDAPVSRAFTFPPRKPVAFEDEAVAEQPAPASEYDETVAEHEAEEPVAMDVPEQVEPETADEGDYDAHEAEEASYGDEGYQIDEPGAPLEDRSVENEPLELSQPAEHSDPVPAAHYDDMEPENEPETFAEEPTGMSIRDKLRHSQSMSDDEETVDEELVLDNSADGLSPLEADMPASPPPKTGGTLFERMSRLSRGSAKEENGDSLAGDDGDGDDAGGLEIPRFLNRQNNQ